MLNNVTTYYLLNNLYSETNWTLTRMYSAKDNIDTFYSITHDIIRFIEKEDIRFSDLSIQGLHANHSVNVAILNGQIGKFSNMTNLYDLVLGGLLHDIGKLDIPRSILNKKTKLTFEEISIISHHTDIGYEIIKKLSDNKNILNIIKNHHKTIKGLNVPVNLKEITTHDDIIYPLICGISDITDAMLSYRSYKSPLTIKETKDELTHFGIKNIDEIFNAII